MSKGKEEIKIESLTEKELKTLFYKEIENIKVTKEDEQAYFKKLYDLFIKSNIRKEWKKYKKEDVSRFFRNCFLFLTDEFIKACKKLKLLHSSGKAESFLIVFSKFFGIPVERFCMEGELGSYQRLLESPVSLGSTPYRESEILLTVDVRYPLKTITSDMAEIIKREQEKYFSKYPEEKSMFIKETEDGRGFIASYPFDEWGRYLEIYMLKKQGKTNRELAENFYDTSNETTKRQVLRDNSKAKKLSQNALDRNFPGDYYKFMLTELLFGP